VYSFIIDYNQIGNVAEDSEDSATITLWIGTGRDQANVIKAMIDETFTSVYNINVNVQLVVQQNIKLLIGLRTRSAPPEPAAARLVKRTPQNRHACILQNQKLFGDCSNVIQQKLVAFLILAVHNRRQINIGAFHIKAVVPLAGQIFCRRIPVPAECHNPAILPELNRVLRRIRGTAILRP